ncbi:hypothetical protein JOM56_011541, partial [Amanita muscaria]
MKSFKVLTLLPLAAALFCGANGAPATNATDGFIKRQTKDELNTVSKSVFHIAKKAWEDNHNLAEFAKATLQGLVEESKHYNYILCRKLVKHNYKFDGTKGVDWVAFPLNILDANVQWDVIIGGAGTFTHEKKFSNANCAWNGVIAQGQDLNSATLKFVKPAGGTRQYGT